MHLPNHARYSSPRALAPRSAPASTAPLHGDVIVHREAPPHGVRYSLREYPGEPQILCGSRESALSLARGFARARGVQVWEDDGDTVTRTTGTGHSRSRGE
jgi:hypothetical protein